MNYESVTSKSDIDQLLGKKSQYGDFEYSYGNETISLLKNNFDLPDSLYLLVKDGEKFAGFVSCDRDWWEDNCFFLREIFVDETYQGQGIGRELMARCVDHAQKRNALILVTQTAFENIPMQKLCESFGFQKWDNPRWQEGITYKLFLK